MAEDISFLQEIDESLRVEKWEQFWRQNGKLVIAGCVAIVLSTIASVTWKNHVREEHMKQTDMLVHADDLLATGKTDEAVALFKDAEKGTPGLAAIAKFRRAEIAGDADKMDEATALYKEIAATKSSDVDDALRDLARLRADIIASNTGKGHAEYENNTTFASIASEMKALSLMQAGKNAEARQLLDGIVQNNELPKSERMRALELQSTIPEGKK